MSWANVDVELLRAHAEAGDDRARRILNAIATESCGERRPLAG